jgi:hypothetical protein
MSSCTYEMKEGVSFDESNDAHAMQGEATTRVPWSAVCLLCTCMGTFFTYLKMRTTACVAHPMTCVVFCAVIFVAISRRFHHLGNSSDYLKTAQFVVINI